MRTAAITTLNYPGVAAVLTHMSALGLCDFLPIESGLDAPYLSQNYDLVIFGAWLDVYEKTMPYIKCKKAILWTSSPGQTAITEFAIIQKIFLLLNANRFDYLLFGSKEMAEMFSYNPKVKWFPYPFAEELIKK